MKLLFPLLCASLIASSAVPAAELGQQAPPLSISAWVKGKPVNIAAGKGKNIYVVEFWATWCGPCLTSIPHLTALQNKYRDKNVVFIGISNEDGPTVSPFVKRMGSKMNYTVALDRQRRTSSGYMRAFGISGVPHAFVVDKQGRIAWHGHPMSGLEQVLEQMVAGTFDIQTAAKAEEVKGLMMSYLRKMAIGDKSPAARQLGEEIVKEAGNNPTILNQFAWIVLTDRRIKVRHKDLAMKAAKKAYKLTEGEVAAIGDTYARALFMDGQRDRAIRLQKDAISIAKTAEERRQLENSLAEYQRAAGR